jgi:hypothetical protein
MMPYDTPQLTALGFAGWVTMRLCFFHSSTGSECVRLETGNGSGFSFGVLKRWVC